MSNGYNNINNSLTGLSSINCDDLNTNSIETTLFQNIPSSYFSGIQSNIQAQINSIIVSGTGIQTIRVGTVTALAAGSTPTVTFTGTSVNLIINFGIPNGINGATGATGSTGSKGDKGDTGATGAAGSGALDVATLAALVITVAAIEAQLAVMEAEIAGVIADVTAVQAQITALEASITSIDASITNLETDVNALMGKTALQTCNGTTMTTFSDGLTATSLYADSLGLVGDMSCNNITSTGNINVGTSSASIHNINGQMVNINALSINLNGIVNYPFGYFAQW